MKAFKPVGKTLSTRTTGRAQKRCIAAVIEQVGAKQCIATRKHFTETVGASLYYSAAKIIVTVTLLEYINQIVAGVRFRVSLTSCWPSGQFGDNIGGGQGDLGKRQRQKEEKNERGDEHGRRMNVIETVKKGIERVGGSQKNDQKKKKISFLTETSTLCICMKKSSHAFFFLPTWDFQTHFNHRSKLQCRQR